MVGSIKTITRFDLIVGVIVSKGALEELRELIHQGFLPEVSSVVPFSHSGGGNVLSISLSLFLAVSTRVSRGPWFLPFLFFIKLSC